MKTNRPDKYSRQIARLKKRPERIRYEWSLGTGLFQFTGGLLSCAGCLTQIRNGGEGPTPELTKAIFDDEKLPAHSSLITVAHLPRFAFWQRKIDRMGVRK